MLEYAQRFHLPVLIETGTQYGQMISAMRTRFREIYSIELDGTNYALAVKNFATGSTFIYCRVTAPSRCRNC